MSKGLNNNYNIFYFTTFSIITEFWKLESLTLGNHQMQKHRNRCLMNSKLNIHSGSKMVFK